MKDEFPDAFIKMLGYAIQLDIPTDSLEKVKQNLVLLNAYGRLVHQFDGSGNIKEKKP